MAEINIAEVLEKLNRELLYLQSQPKQDDIFLCGKIDAYEEIIYILEGEPYESN
jgi:hypothetical protein